MNRLTALRPVLYMGRYYQRGDALPANDPLMTVAWLKSGSAMIAPEIPPVPQISTEADSEELPKAERQALNCLAGLGLKFVDKTGEYVGDENFTEQIRILGQSLMQDYADVIPSIPGVPADGELPGESVLDIDPDGHFTRSSLSRMRTAELIVLAEDLGVDLSGCRNNAERVEALAAVDGEALLERKAANAQEPSEQAEAPADVPGDTLLGRQTVNVPEETK